MAATTGLGENDATPRSMHNATPFVMHCIPKFPSTSHIVGLNTIPLERAGHDQHGWHVSDYLAFKSMLDPTITLKPQNQIWYSAANFAEVFATYGKDYFHGYSKPKNVSGAGEDDQILVQSNAEQLMLNFKEAVKQRSEIAKEQRTSLVLIVAGPVTAQQDLVFDVTIADRSSCILVLTTEEIRQAVTPGVPVILITSAVFSGGWLVNLSLTGNEPHGLATTDEARAKWLAQHCAGCFTPDLIETFTVKSSPLLTNEERQNIGHPGQLMPVNATIQAKLLHFELAAQIQQSLSQKFAVHGSCHEFIFENGHYPWNCQADRGPITAYNFLGSAFGASKTSQSFHIRFLAAIDYATIGQETRLSKPQAGNRYLSAVEQFLGMHDPAIDEERLKDIFRVLEYRSTHVLLSDAIVQFAGLLPSQAVGCRYFSPSRDLEQQKQDANYKTAVTKAWRSTSGIDLFRPLHLGIDVNEVMLFGFLKPREYLCSALAAKFSHMPQTELDGAMETFVETHVTSFKRLVRSQQSQMLMQVRTILDVGHRWLQSINLRASDIQSGEVLATDGGAGGRRGGGSQNLATSVAHAVQPTGPTANNTNAPPETAASLNGHASPFLPRQTAEQRSSSPAISERRHPSGTTADSSLLQDMAQMTLNDREPQSVEQSAVVKLGSTSPHMAPAQAAVASKTAEAEASQVKPVTKGSQAATADAVALSAENAQIEQLLKFFLQNPERQQEVMAMLAESTGQPDTTNATTPTVNAVRGKVAANAVQTPLPTRVLAPASNGSSRPSPAPPPSLDHANVATEGATASARGQTNVTISEPNNARAPGRVHPLQENRPPSGPRRANKPAVDADEYYRGRNVEW